MRIEYELTSCQLERERVSGGVSCTREREREEKRREEKRERERERERESEFLDAVTRRSMRMQPFVFIVLC